ncbi:hypothetical protein F25303_4761 [Fusarium sp. NRRL 25303]|nr:hypothetical protein F25303_4761 [Fusarium sp. NRRL 25303]
MAVVTHDIVPNGDICIVLKNPNSVSVIPIVNLRLYGTDPPEYEPDPSLVALNSWQSPALKDNKATEYRFRVSSHTLTAVSPVFRKMLEGPWKESVPFEATTSSDVLDQTPTVPIIREISATDWNVHAFVTILNIIHGRNNEVPRSVGIKFVTDVAVIVNYYECAESVTLAAELWIARSQVIKRYGKPSIMVLCISWIFSWGVPFSSMARLVLEHGEGLEHVDTQDLPIAMIFEKLDKQRQSLVPSIYRRLGELRKDLLNRRTGVKALMQPTFDKIKEDFENIKLADFQAKKV